MTSLKRASIELSDNCVDAKKSCTEGRLCVQQPRRKYTKSVILLMYSGVGYFGMQRNPGFETIEGILFSAFKDANFINEDEYFQPGKVAFQRASKTDKNVSALGQVCSLKLPVDALDTLTTTLNQMLPSQIRIIDAFRSTKSFNAKRQADNRTYQYICPSFSLAPSTVDVNNEQQLLAYRIDPERIAKVNAVLQNYVGTKNYHNFTSGRKPSDKSCRRYILCMDCGEPFMKEDMEFVAITVRGQSFMLHQIRKMIGMTIAILRGHTTESVFEKVFDENKADIPRAPGVGLVLLSANFDFYNNKFQLDGIHKPIQWENYKKSIDAFKVEFVLRYIYETEQKDKTMIGWLNSLSTHTFGPRDESRTLQPLLSKENASDDITAADCPSVHSNPSDLSE